MTAPGSASIIVAFDFGLRRIGVATANRLTGTATPLAVLQSQGSIPWADIDDIVTDWEPVTLVVGRPEQDRETKLSRELHRFIHKLQLRYLLPVAEVDETLTSSEASWLLSDSRHQGRRNRRIVKGDIDQHAACLIAEQWMHQLDRDD